jgi:hypothetical protein
MAVKLIVSDRVAFDVRFDLNVEGIQREFGFRVEATRAPLPAEKDTISDYLAKSARPRMVAWLDGEDGKPLNPFVDADTEQPLPAGEVALEALYGLTQSIPLLVFEGYLKATSATAKLGNSQR